MKKITLLLLFLFSPLAQAQYVLVPSVQEAPKVTYKATTNDEKISEMVQRWAEESKQTLYWDTSYDSNIVNAEELNKQAGLGREDSLLNSVKKVVTHLNEFIDDTLIVCYSKSNESISVRPKSYGCNK